MFITKHFPKIVKNVHSKTFLKHRIAKHFPNIIKNVHFCLKHTKKSSMESPIGAVKNNISKIAPHQREYPYIKSEFPSNLITTYRKWRRIVLLFGASVLRREWATLFTLIASLWWLVLGELMAISNSHSYPSTIMYLFELLMQCIIVIKNFH